MPGKKPAWLRKTSALALMLLLLSIQRLWNVLKAQGLISVKDNWDVSFLPTVKSYHEDKPRVVMLPLLDTGTGFSIEHNHHSGSRARTIELDTDNEKKRKRGPSKNDSQDTWENHDCFPRSRWQGSPDSFRPILNCNTVHEIHLMDELLEQKMANNKPILLGVGAFRVAWLVQNDYLHSQQAPAVVLRTLQAHRDPGRLQVHARNRQDALLMELLTSSRWVLDAYAFCGTSTITEYANNGDLEHIRIGNNNMTPEEKLRVATQIAMGLADFHILPTVGDEPLVAHTDLKESQFLKVGSNYKLSDFNLAHSIGWQADNATTCFQWLRRPKVQRIPEEHLYLPPSAKMDVYALGNIFYTILQGTPPFADLARRRVGKLISQGVRPVLNESIRNETNPLIVAIRTAMDDCLPADPTNRSSSRVIANNLKSAMDKVGLELV